LAAKGYPTVDESARAIIAERVGRGATARPDLPAFAREILRRDVAKYIAPRPIARWVFFDRGLVDALGLLHEVSPQPPGELQKTLARYRFH
jgi:predicted ATPase